MGLQKTIGIYTNAYHKIMLNNNANKENVTDGVSVCSFTVFTYDTRDNANADTQGTNYLYSGNKCFEGADYPLLKASVKAADTDPEKLVYEKLRDQVGSYGEIKLRDRYGSYEWFDLKDATDVLEAGQ